MNAREQGAGMKARKRPRMALSLTGLFRKELGHVAFRRCRVLYYGLQILPGDVVISVSLRYQVECGTVTGILSKIEPMNLVRNCTRRRFRVIIPSTSIFGLRTVPLTSSSESVMTLILIYLPTNNWTITLVRFPLSISTNRSFGCSVWCAVLLERPP